MTRAASWKRARAVFYAGVIWASMAAAAVVGARAQDRDWLAPRSRQLEHTAYTLQQHQLYLQVGAYGSERDDLYGELELAYGLGYGLQLGSNLFHCASGNWNIDLDWGLVDQSWIGVSLSTGLGLGVVQQMWVVREIWREMLRDVQLLTVPVQLTASLPVLDWLQIDLSAGYTHVSGFGEIDFSLGRLGGTLAQSELFVKPVVRVYVSPRLALIAQAHLPLWAELPVDVRTTVGDDDDPLVDFRTAERERVPFSENWGFKVGAETPVAANLSVRLQFAYSVPATDFYRTAVLPTVQLLYRTGMGAGE